MIVSCQVLVPQVLSFPLELSSNAGYSSKVVQMEYEQHMTLASPLIRPLRDKLFLYSGYLSTKLTSHEEFCRTMSTPGHWSCPIAQQT
eukprot:Em0015g847a